MRQIKSKNTLPEIRLRKALHRRGHRYRLNVKSLPGKPDLVLQKHRSVVEVRGCFWHGHKGCRYFNLPKTRTEWWGAKISATRERDKRNKTTLEEMGWKVIVVWECTIKDNIEQVVLNIEENLWTN